VQIADFVVIEKHHECKIEFGKSRRPLDKPWDWRKSGLGSAGIKVTKRRDKPILVVLS